MKATDFYHAYDESDNERSISKDKLPLHFYPETGEVFDKIGNFIGDGEIKNNKLVISIIL